MTTQLLRRVERITNKNKKVIARKAKKYIKDTQKRIQQINRKYVRKMVTSSMAIKMVAYVTVLVAISANYQPGVVDAQAWSSHLQFDKSKAVPVSVEQKKVDIKVVPIEPPKPAVVSVKETARNTTARERAPKVAPAKPVTSAPAVVTPAPTANISQSAIKAYAERRSNEKFGVGHFPALLTLWNRESGWNYRAYNASSTACGIPQAMPCSKGGANFRNDPYKQIEWGLNYIAGRYKNPTNALAFWNSKHWY